jgi:hypothetical protein
LARKANSQDIYIDNQLLVVIDSSVGANPNAFKFDYWLSIIIRLIRDIETSASYVDFLIYACFRLWYLNYR